MNWQEAQDYMNEGGRITRKSWLKYDYLYIKDGLLFCDGGFECIGMLKRTTGNWIPHYSGLICDDCFTVFDLEKEGIKEDKMEGTICGDCVHELKH